MAIKYISSAASGSDDGTSATHASGTTGPWTLAQMLSATPAAGDELRIMADGTYSRSATGTVAYANGTAAANIVITGASSSGTVDGTRPTIQASAGSITLINVTGSHVRVDSLILDGNAQTSTTGLTLGANYCRARKCKAMGCTVKGINVADNFNVTVADRCTATGCSGTCGIYVGAGTAVQFCESYGNTCHGFQSTGLANLFGCIASANTTTGVAGGGGSIDGFNHNAVGYKALGCTSYGNGRAGFDLTSNAGFGTYLSNCLAYGNGGEGFATDGVKSGAFLLDCGGGSNTSGNYNTTNIPNVEGFVALSADPFTSKSTGDFSLNTTAGGGAACRAAGFPGLMPRGTTTGYADIGAAQHADPAGGTSTIPPGPIRGNTWQFVG